MTLTPEQIAKLEDAARKATPGTWYVNDLYKHIDDQKGSADTHGNVSFSQSRYVESESSTVCVTGNKTRDVEFIALANPQTILALIAALREATAELHDCPVCHHKCIECDCMEKRLAERDAAVLELCAAMASMGISIEVVEDRDKHGWKTTDIYRRAAEVHAKYSTKPAT